MWATLTLHVDAPPPPIATTKEQSITPMGKLYTRWGALITARLPGTLGMTDTVMQIFLSKLGALRAPLQYQSTTTAARAFVAIWKLIQPRAPLPPADNQTKCNATQCNLSTQGNSVGFAAVYNVHDHVPDVSMRCLQGAVRQHDAPPSIENSPLKALCNGQNFAREHHSPMTNV